jgi:hypothetical protein
MPETTKDLRREGFDLTTLTDPDGLTWEQWRDELFSTEFCSECGLDGPDHEPWILGGHWFAHCTGVKLTKLGSKVWNTYLVTARRRGIVLGEVSRYALRPRSHWSIWVSADTESIETRPTRAEAVERLIELARDRGLLEVT